MVTVRPDVALAEGQNAMPLLWTVQTPVSPDPWLYPDAALAALLPPGRGIALRSFGHDRDSVHWLLTRAGTPLHRDPAYARYSYQLVLRNDGNRLRGLPRYDQEHPVLRPGVMYCLDTHSPHQGLPDPRMDPPKVVLKLAAAVDSDTLVGPNAVWPLLVRFVGRELPAALDPGYKAAPRQVWNP
jgi:hypothetical protein